MNAFELTHEDIAKCKMRENHEGLGESLKMMIQKLQVINRFKEEELQIKIEDEQKKRKIIE